MNLPLLLAALLFPVQEQTNDLSAITPNEAALHYYPDIYPRPEDDAADWPTVLIQVDGLVVYYYSEGSANAHLVAAIWPTIIRLRWWSFSTCMKGPRCPLRVMCDCWETPEIDGATPEVNGWILMLCRTLPFRCTEFDFDGDLDVDLHDFWTFQQR